MTPQEAINIIEDVTWQDNDRHYGKVVPAREIAISALEKQIPKKAIVNEDYLNMKYTVGICPNCKEMLGLLVHAKTYKHCCKCGQALDWSNDE